MRTTFSTPVTPTRERPIGTEGARACTSSPKGCVGDSEWICRVACTSPKPSGPSAPDPPDGEARRARSRERAVTQPAYTTADFWYHFALDGPVNPRPIGSHNASSIGAGERTESGSDFGATSGEQEQADAIE